MKAYRPVARKAAKPFAWNSMGAWVRLMHRLFALEAPSSEHYRRARETARALTVERIREWPDTELNAFRVGIEARVGNRMSAGTRLRAPADRGSALAPALHAEHVAMRGRTIVWPRVGDAVRAVCRAVAPRHGAGMLVPVTDAKDVGVPVGRDAHVSDREATLGGRARGGEGRRGIRPVEHTERVLAQRLLRHDAEVTQPSGMLARFSSGAVRSSTVGR